MKALICFIFFVFTHAMSPFHNINMTVTDIRYKEQKLYVKIKFFADDFQGSLSEMSKGPVDIVNSPIETQEANIRKYINNRLVILVNNLQVKLNYKKVYLSRDVIFVEYEAVVIDPKKITSMKIKNILMFENFPEQKNVVNIDIKSQVEMLSFDNDESGKKFKKINFK